jgi:hypothetical protein
MIEAADSCDVVMGEMPFEFGFASAAHFDNGLGVDLEIGDADADQMAHMSARNQP